MLRILTFWGAFQGYSGITCGPKSSGWKPLVCKVLIIALGENLLLSLDILSCTAKKFQSSQSIKMTTEPSRGG